MKIVTQQFKDNLRTFGRELDTKITYGDNVLDKEILNGVNLTFNTSIFKTIMKGVEIDSNVFIPLNSVINVKSGVLVNNSYEYIDYGDFKVYKEPQINEDTQSYIINGYDRIIESMIEYDLGITYPITVRDMFINIFNRLNWDISKIPATFTNSTKEIQKDLYTGIGYTFRDVLDELCTITGQWLIDKNGVPMLVQPTQTNEIIDEEYLSDVNVSVKEKVFFNSLVFSRAGESDNIYRRDEDSIKLNGVHEFKIIDNQLLSNNDRDIYIDELWNFIKTFEYYSFDNETIGIMFLEPIDMFKLKIRDIEYPTLLLNDDIKITQGLTEHIYSDKPKESKTEYKYADSTDKRINQAYIIVDKKNQEIKANVSRIENDLNNNYYNVEKIDQLILDTKSGLTNSFLTSGGNNLLRNTAPYFMESDTKAEFWEGNVKKVRNEESVSGYSLLIQKGVLSQTVNLSPGQYAIKFKYKKLLLDAVGTVKYNGRTITLDKEQDTIETTGVVNSGRFEVKIESNYNDSFEIYDLMLNIGDISTPWTQNANESTSDTVNISEGITVSSNKTNTNAKMDSDGFRVVNKSNNRTVLKGTDTGIETDEVKSNKGEIAELFIKKVGNQTWISGV